MKIEYSLLWSLSFLVVYIDAAKVAEISYTSQGSPDFYLNDEVTFTCTAAGFLHLGLLRLIYNNSFTGREGCDYHGLDHMKWTTGGAPYIGTVDGLDSPHLTIAYCNSVGKEEGFSISIDVTITDAAVRGKFFCRANEGSNTYSREEFVTSVKVAPANLTMSVPEDVVEGDGFEMKCESTGSVPVSSYKYDIKRGGAVVANGSTYTPTEPDREGFTVTCIDTAHPNWKGRNTMLSKEVVPKYIDVAVDDPNLAESNPNELKCADYVTGNPLPDTFSWTQQGSRLQENSSTLNLTETSGGTEDTVTCVASNGLGKSVTITWSVTRSSDTTTTPTTTPTSGATVGIHGDLVTLTALITALIIIYGAVY